MVVDGTSLAIIFVTAHGVQEVPTVARYSQRVYRGLAVNSGEGGENVWTVRAA